MYHVEDQEIDLTKVMKTELPPVPRDISFTGTFRTLSQFHSLATEIDEVHVCAAHWLAIEGVQPLIKENPTPSGKLFSLFLVS